MTHSHNYKYATFNSESAAQVNSALKETRELLQEVRRERGREGERGRYTRRSYMYIDNVTVTTIKFYRSAEMNKIANFCFHFIV